MNSRAENEGSGEGYQLKGCKVLSGLEPCGVETPEAFGGGEQIAEGMLGQGRTNSPAPLGHGS